MFQTTTVVCNGLVKKESSLILAQRIASMNGYISHLGPECAKKCCHKTLLYAHGKDIHLPALICDEVIAAIRKFLRTATLDISVAAVKIPPHTLRRQLIKNRDTLYAPRENALFALEAEQQSRTA